MLPIFSSVRKIIQSPHHTGSILPLIFTSSSPFKLCILLKQLPSTHVWLRLKALFKVCLEVLHSYDHCLPICDVSDYFTFSLQSVLSQILEVS